MTDTYDTQPVRFTQISATSDSIVFALDDIGQLWKIEKVVDPSHHAESPQVYWTRTPVGYQFGSNQ